MVFIDNLGIGARQIHFKSPLSDYLDWGRAYLHTVDTMKPKDRKYQFCHVHSTTSSG